MKVTITTYGKKREYKSLEDCAEDKLCGEDYGIGVMEAAASRARNNSKAIGRLLDILAGKLLTEEDVAHVLYEYIDEDLLKFYEP